MIKKWSEDGGRRDERALGKMLERRANATLFPRETNRERRETERPFYKTSWGMAARELDVIGARSGDV